MSMISILFLWAVRLFGVEPCSIAPEDRKAQDLQLPICAVPDQTPISNGF